ncbi:MAG: glycosyltransferase family 4 protein [Acidobacteriota bacterium]
MDWGGAQVLFFGLMKEAKKFGEVIAVLPEGSNSHLLKFLDNLGVSCQFVDSHTDGKPALKLKRKLERHRNKIKSEYAFIRYLNKLDLKNSIIHTEFAPWQSFTALYFLSLKAPVFVTMHNSLPENLKWRSVLWRIKFRLLMSSKNFYLFTANQDTKNSLKYLISQKYIDRVKIIYANIDPDEIEDAMSLKLNRQDICSQYNLPENKFYIFCVGQFIDRKGRWVFLEAANKLLKSNKDLMFVWISNSKPDLEDLEKVKTYGLGENFSLITSDQVGNEHIDLFKLMRLADVFTLPSYVEGLPISIIEAMALGLPTISTDINAIPEAVKHLETGILIKPGSSDELVNSIQMLKDDENLREQISEKGREYVLEKFNQKKVVKIAVESYIEAFNNK